THRTLDSSTWLAESKVAAKQAEPSDEAVVGLEAINESRKTMNIVFGCIYGLLAISAIGSVGKSIKKIADKESEELEKQNKEKSNEEN
ncbi:hypothetical protein KY334_05860, partial [Candidatus Woesearchaeota archaeon]|nr:hypothetical protein [Candidatus Woesearchaeota archaeon]